MASARKEAVAKVLPNVQMFKQLNIMHDCSFSLLGLIRSMMYCTECIIQRWCYDIWYA